MYGFVKEYRRLQGEAEFSFREAVSYVASEFSDDEVQFADLLLPGSKQSSTSSPSYPRLTEEERQAIQERKQRVLAANAAASAFFAQALTKPQAGGARFHLRQRGLQPEIIKLFRLGFAPDEYYGKHSKATQWGEGSLVEHLKELGFSPDEILASGLAIRTKANHNRFAAVEDLGEKESIVSGTFTLFWTALLHSLR